MSQDQNLLFGVMAVQLKFLTPQKLMEAAAAWAIDRDKPIRAHLIESGLITQTVAEMIDGLLAAQIDAHGGDIHATLQSFGGAQAVHASFAASSVLFESGIQLPASQDQKVEPATEPEPEACDKTLAGGFESFGGGSMPSSISAPGLDTVSIGGQNGEGDGLVTGAEKLTFEHPGRYTLQREYARGGIGKVMLAFDSHVGRKIAIKELLPDRSGGTPSTDSSSRKTDASIIRFLREARITGQLEHPSIVPVYEIGKRPDGKIYYTMRFVRGKTMAKALKEAKNYDERMGLLTHYHDLTNAMRYAHSRNVIHRDLKPHNVMVGEFGETVVLDWGLAKVKGKKDTRARALAHELEKFRELQSATETIQGIPIGTPAYMSPEQAEGRIGEVDERSDVWSLGVMLFEILTGKLPFGEDNDHPLVIMGRVLKDEPKSALRLEPQASDELAAVALKCLQKDPDQRYQTSDHLAKDIDRFLTGRLVSAYDYSRVKLFKRWLRKWWPVALTATVATLTLIIVFTWSYINILEQKNIALNNIAEAYLATGWWAAAEGRWPTAQIFFGKSLIMNDRKSTRYALNYARTMPRAPARLKLALRDRGHTGKITGIAISPDGKYLASAGTDAKVILWDLSSGQAARSYTDHNKTVNAVAFSPDGSRLASAGDDGKVCMWDVSSKNLLKCWTGPGKPIKIVKFSSDGKTIAAAGEDLSAMVVNLDSMEKKDLAGHAQKIWGMNFSPDGKRLATCSRDQTVRVWDLRRGVTERTLKGHTNSVSNAHFLPENRLLTSSWDKSLKLWDLSSGELIHSATEDGNPVFLEPQDDPDLVLVGYEDGFMRLIDLTKWECKSDTGVEKCGFPHKRRWTTAHSGQLLQMLMLDRKGRFVTCGGDKVLKFWQTAERRPDNIMEGRDAISLQKLAVGPGGKILATTGDDGLVRVWAINGGDSATRVPLLDSVGAEAKDQKDRFIVYASDLSPKIVAINPLTGDTLGRLEGHTGPVSALSLSADGRRLVSAGKDRKVLFWDLAAMKPAEPIAPLAGSTAHSEMTDFIAAAITPDGTRAVTAADDGKVIVWDTQTAAILHQYPDKPDNLRDVLAISPDGNYAALGLVDGRYKIWDLRTGALRRELAGHAIGSRTAAFSPDGKVLATGGKDYKVMIWDLETGQKITDITRHTHWIRFTEFSADGRYLFSGGVFDNTVNVWDTKSWELVCYQLLTDRPISIAAKTDASLVAVGSREGKITLFEPAADADSQCRTQIIMPGHTASVDNLALVPAPDGFKIISGGEEGAVMIWPFSDQALAEDPEALYQDAESETGFMVEGMELAPFLPELDQKQQADQK